ncbi:MAG: hypothetical protein WBD02_06205 [Acidimicrobiia bacterium]
MAVPLVVPALVLDCFVVLLDADVFPEFDAADVVDDPGFGTGNAPTAADMLMVRIAIVIPVRIEGVWRRM